MIILASTLDKLQVVTSTADAVDVYAAWLDNAPGAVSVGRSNTAIAAAAVTDVVNSPAAGIQRNVRSLHVRNKGIGTNEVIVRHTDGITAVDLYAESLPPDGQLQYNDGNGFAAP
jgi:hypothetical protein